VTTSPQRVALVFLTGKSPVVVHKVSPFTLQPGPVWLVVRGE
jgi:hypothetical protein